MKVSITKTPPSSEELLSILNTEMNDGSAKLFGLGPNKTILFKKSTFVGAQITRRGQELFIEGIFPSVLSTALSGLLMLGCMFYFLESIFYSRWLKLEKEIGLLLNEKYH